jgi:hypothetical protein
MDEANAKARVIEREFKSLDPAIWCEVYDVPEPFLT